MTFPARLARFRPLAALSLLILSACAAPGGSPPATGDDPSAPAAAAAPPGERTAMPPPVDRRTLTPERLKGLHAVQVEGALGAPSFRRRDPPAEIWQYRMGTCTLDLFLYKETDGVIVAHYAVRSPPGSGVTERACLDEVLNRGAERPVS
ncbi:hypothetical protein [Magnetospirillum sp. SS-4]|uniref:hypothetical protein n=1 Tax=Magnetospirillum sp. SS-4 TaxID=2681465 RepID=UPI0015746C40|nr:hypothetical protein [Magnetospirillum sp. SS-4]